jgi:hypothetical protein
MMIREAPLRLSPDRIGEDKYIKRGVASGCAVDFAG